MNRLNDIISNLSVRIIQSFHVKHDHSWRERKTKPDYTLWGIKEGNVSVIIGEKRFDAHSGDAILFYPGNDYYAETDEEGCEFIAIHFMLETGNGMDLLTGLNLAGIADGKKLHTVSFCEKILNNRPVAVNTSFEGYVAFINYVHEIIKVQQKPDAVHFYEYSDKGTKSTMQKAVEYILANYQSVTVSQVASRVYMHEKRFISDFKKSVGISPGQFISNCKMRKAANLLTETDMKLAEIAASLGFSDQYSFSKAFKRSFGDSPSVFRKSSRF